VYRAGDTVAQGEKGALNFLYAGTLELGATSREIRTVELADRSGRALVARRTLVQEVPLADENAASAVAAFDSAVARMLDELVPWLEREAAKAGAA